MWFGKIIGAGIGAMVASVPGALIGGALGHFFDRGLAQFRPDALTGDQRAEAESVFFETVFSLLGMVAKADGRVSEEEIAQTEQVMTQMGLSADHRADAIDYFKQGSSAEFDLDGLMERFLVFANRLPRLKQTVLTYLINIALADGNLDEAEEQCLTGIADKLGFSSFAFRQLIGMIKAQMQFQRQRQQSTGGFQTEPSKDALATAYDALGVSADVNDQTLKRTYRKLMSDNHPDKLMGQGVPQDMIEQATERSQNIQAAYELIKKHRKATA